MTWIGFVLVLSGCCLLVLLSGNREGCLRPRFAITIGIIIFVVASGLSFVNLGVQITGSVIATNLLYVLVATVGGAGVGGIIRKIQSKSEAVERIGP